MRRLGSALLQLDLCKQFFAQEEPQRAKLINLGWGQGHYGTGEVGFVRRDQYLTDLGVLVRYEPMIIVLPIGSMILAAVAAIFAHTNARESSPVAGLKGQSISVVDLYLNPERHQLFAAE